MKYLARIFEEIFPLVLFMKNKKRIFSSLADGEGVASNSEKYMELDIDTLNIRIQEEHERAVKIDEKTSKFTLGLSVSLTVLAAAAGGSFLKFIPDNGQAVVISIICGVASLYMLAAGITALGAFKTLPTYGYGSDHLLQLKKNGASYLSEALYAQERMNIVRHLRNETAYQSLRNGFFMLFFALCVSVVLLSNIPKVTKSEPAVEEVSSNNSNSVGKETPKSNSGPPSLEK